MFLSLGLFFIYINLCITFATIDNDNLVKVIVLFRHGKRAPVYTYFFDGKKLDEDEYLWPEGCGNLVKEGKQQLYFLGHKLRQRYEKVLIPYHDSIGKDVRTVTTPSDRCYQSAACLLASFYSPSNEQKWTAELNWQPVPIYFTSPDKMKIIGNISMCREYDEELNSVKALVSKTDANVHYLIELLSSHVTSKEIVTIDDLFYVADYFQTKAAFTPKTPDWMTEEDLKKIFEFRSRSFNYLTHSVKMRRLLTGPLITDIILRMNETVYKLPENSRFFFYSGHDSSLHSLARSFGIQLQSAPYFGATLIIELYKFSSNDFRLKLLYSDDYTLDILKTFIIAGCEELCPLRKFISLMDKYTISDLDWQNECK